LPDYESNSPESNTRDSFDFSHDVEEVISSNPMDVNLFASSPLQMDVVTRLKEDSIENSSEAPKWEKGPQEDEEDVEKFETEKSFGNAEATQEGDFDVPVVPIWGK
jgi:hypothetical protein